MAELPYVSLNVNDMIARISHMSTEERGAYLSIMFAMWKGGGFLADDPVFLARVAGCGRKKWRALGPRAMVGMTILGGRISDPALLSLMDLTRSKRNARSHAAQASWGKRKSLKSQESGYAFASVLHVQTPRNQNHNIQSSLLSQNPGAAKRPPMEDRIDDLCRSLAICGMMKSRAAEAKVRVWLTLIKADTGALSLMFAETQGRGLTGKAFVAMVETQVRSAQTREAPKLPFPPQKIIG